MNLIVLRPAFQLEPIYIFYRRDYSCLSILIIVAILDLQDIIWDYGVVYAISREKL